LLLEQSNQHSLYPTITGSAKSAGKTDR